MANKKFKKLFKLMLKIKKIILIFTMIVFKEFLYDSKN